MKLSLPLLIDLRCFYFRIPFRSLEGKVEGLLHKSKMGVQSHLANKQYSILFFSFLELRENDWCKVIQLSSSLKKDWTAPGI